MLCFWGLLKIMKIIFFFNTTAHNSHYWRIWNFRACVFGSKCHSPHLALLRQIAIAAQDSRQHSQSGVARFTLVVLHTEQPPDHQFQTLNLKHTETEEHWTLTLLASFISCGCKFRCHLFTKRKKKLTEKKNLSSHIGWESMQYRLRCESLWYFLQ